MSSLQNLLGRRSKTSHDMIRESTASTAIYLLELNQKFIWYMQERIDELEKRVAAARGSRSARQDETDDWATTEEESDLLPEDCEPATDDADNRSDPLPPVPPTVIKLSPSVTGPAAFFSDAPPVAPAKPEEPPVAEEAVVVSPTAALPVILPVEEESVTVSPTTASPVIPPVEEQPVTVSPTAASPIIPPVEIAEESSAAPTAVSLRKWRTAAPAVPPDINPALPVDDGADEHLPDATMVDDSTDDHLSNTTMADDSADDHLPDTKMADDNGPKGEFD